MKWALSWFLFWLGDLAHRILELGSENLWWASFWYPIYNQLMTLSYRIQGAGEGPWE